MKKFLLLMAAAILTLLSPGASAAQPDSPEGWYDNASTYVQAGKYGKAAKCYEKAAKHGLHQQLTS